MTRDYDDFSRNSPQLLQALKADILPLLGGCDSSSLWWIRIEYAGDLLGDCADNASSDRGPSVVLEKVEVGICRQL